MSDSTIDFSAMANRLTAGYRPVADAPVVMVPKGMEAVSLVEYLPAPPRQHGCFDTASLADFAVYIAAQNLGPDAECYVAIDAPTCRAILRAGDGNFPAWHDWTARLSLIDSPAFLALRGLTVAPVLPDAIIDLIDDWGGHCAFIADGQAISTEAARARFSDCTVETIRSLCTARTDLTRERSGMEKLTMQSGLPTRLTFTCAPWEGLEARPVKVRIAAADSGNTAMLRVSLIDWEAVREELLQQFSDALRVGLLGTGALLYRGSFTRDSGR